MEALRYCLKCPEVCTAGLSFQVSKTSFFQSASGLYSDFTNLHSLASLALPLRLHFHHSDSKEVTPGVQSREPHSVMSQTSNPC
jgi:hypothetical protein